ncbi:hypothetical protein NDU88_003580 [Pleurodeles waltl]|uniref:Uncharacterized protein n=1 Tax=Pleurodeles waltl TaxID=8319 RepID=A0AAV7LNI8_PLEWA|nr:hypothetical protein NDU88_003580 [Pleurodeles waltl]
MQSGVTAVRGADGNAGLTGAEDCAIAESLPGAPSGQGGSGSCSLPGKPWQSQHRAGIIGKEVQDIEDSTVYQGLV